MTGCADCVGCKQANIKLEAHGFAIVDATKALELDPSYIKVRWVPSTATGDRNRLLMFYFVLDRRTGDVPWPIPLSLTTVRL